MRLSGLSSNTLRESLNLPERGSTSISLTVILSPSLNPASSNLSHPPLLFAEYILPAEGSYLWVDKNLILLVTVAVLMLLPASKAISFDSLLFRKSR